ncbi:hypothetical protein NQ317_015135 [Molorchus minor]|uniref:Tetratricopeptide repeat protein 21B n=1 Tax=Molorchus minor TaxID=1323400 RepID=A0ABQ9K5R0_9CUCU|nr:hypothetical protein NQ317_015135 [Molorchus minor]
MDKSDETDLKSKIFHYFREKQYTHMLNCSKEGISKFKGEISFHLYHSLALILLNRLEEGLHDLEAIRNENEVKLAVNIALIYAHKLLGVSNKELFLKLDAQLKEHRKTADAVDFYHSAFVLVCLNKSEKSLDYAEKALTMQSVFPDCLTLKGWILLQLCKLGKRTATNIKDIFEHALQQNQRNLDAIIGVTECYLVKRDFTEALNNINKAVVRYSSTNLPLLQKLKILLAAQDWDQAVETVNRITASDPKEIYAKKVLIVILLSRFANYEEAATEIRKFLQLLESLEVRNVHLFLENAQLFSRICGRNTEILSETSKMLNIALQSNSDNAEIVVELGYQALLSQKTKEAIRFFRSATKIDETSLNALIGLSLCELKDNGNTDQLKKPELKDAQESLQLRFIQAKISETSETALNHLQTICDIKLSQLKPLFYSEGYLLCLDADFMLDVIKESMQHIIEYNRKSLPGLCDALFLLAKLQCIKGDNTNAMDTLEKLLSNVATPQSEAQLLMAQIQLQHGLYDRAAHSLEACVSSDFRVRENPMFHYITALVDKYTNNHTDAIKSLTTALSLVNIPLKETSWLNISLVDKASIYVELIDALNMVGRNDEAAKILEDATEELTGTPEETRILLLSAEHALKRKNIQDAIDLLSKVKPTDLCYMEAKSRHAEVLLNYRKDKYAYLQCYQDFVRDNPGVESYVMLGDAYMKVLEPDDALEYYEKALKENPNDPVLVSKMGKVLVDTHYFQRAIKYYKEVIKNSNDPELKLQLAELYMNLREGELILLTQLEEEKSNAADDLTYLQFKTRLLVLLSQVQEKSGNVTYALKSLKDAMDNQNRVRKRLAVEQNVVPQSEIHSLINISMKLGEMASALKNNEQAINYYKEGLEVSPNNTSILAALAKLYMQMNYLELCQQTCAAILKNDPENETASVMMADIAFRKVDFDMAQFHFTQLVTKQPTNWEGLVRLIEILRRTGNIQDCQEYLNAAERACENPSRETGFLYCTALYQWYSGNLNGALRNFNNARQDPAFGQSAIYNMIEICLNPDDEMFGDQFMDSDDIEYRDSRSMALKTADRLLKELKQRLEAGGDEILKCKLLINFRLLATKDKYNIERALEEFVALASENAYKDNIGVILGIATAYTLLKQTQRAKNQLKRIVKSTWTFEDAEYLERCWLLLADYYIQSSKYDIATDLINKVVQHNKACARAHEYLGFISEKEQRYKDAVNYYDQAWKFGGKSNPTICFKLAYCLMKCKKYPDAIDMAQEVLKISPDYPRVKKDILDKCMNNLRI